MRLIGSTPKLRFIQAEYVYFDLWYTDIDTVRTNVIDATGAVTPVCFGQYEPMSHRLHRFAYLERSPSVSPSGRFCERSRRSCCICMSASASSPSPAGTVIITMISMGSLLAAG